jgi:hypothetical protein
VSFAAADCRFASDEQRQTLDATAPAPALLPIAPARMQAEASFLPEPPEALPLAPVTVAQPSTSQRSFH